MGQQMRWPISDRISIFLFAMLAATMATAQSLSDACPGADIGKPIGIRIQILPG
jgi:hypothetical protein